MTLKLKFLGLGCSSVVSVCQVCMKPWVQPQEPHKGDVVEHACSPNNSEVHAGGVVVVQDHPSL